MTEISFLIELLLNHKLTKATKDLIAERIKAIQIPVTQAHPTTITYNTSGLVTQVASTVAAMVKHAETAPLPVEQIAQTPATAAAMQHRQDMINRSISGKLHPDSTGKAKKW